MNTPKNYWKRRKIPWVSSIVAGMALGLGMYIGYQLGLHAYKNALLDKLWADIYYAENPVDCPPCDEGATYEWFFFEPPLDNHQPKEEANPTAKREGGAAMGP